jgi:uncharacterized phiE125 gp8 family phage protein
MATPLTTLANVKDWLQITSTASDALLTRMITAFSDAVANYINRDLGSQTYALTRDGNGGTTLMFVNYPVTAVTGLVIDGVTIPARAAFGSNGYVFTTTRITLVGYKFTQGSQNVQLSTVAGYVTIPTELEQAVIEWIADRYASRDRISIMSKSLSGETISYAQNDIPDPVVAILSPYRKVVPN